MPSRADVNAKIERVLRAHQGRLIAALSTRFRDIGLAEDVLQDAVTAALNHWPKKGIPHNPQGWLFQTAKRKAIDRFRRQSTRRTKAGELTQQAELAQAIYENPEPENQAIPDERLRLIFTCCHPAVPEVAHTALTLKTICGLSTEQISAAYLVPKSTVAQRIVRAKNKIKQARIPFTIPGPDLWPQRLQSVLSVIYLIFNAGYSNLTPDKQAADLCAQAIHLGRILAKLLPQETEVGGLLSLMLLNHARRPARIANPEIYISLEDQNRTLWDNASIIAGQNLLLKTLTQGKPGSYQIQAAISAVHCQAATFADTDWPEITALYERLYAYEPTPVVLLNASVALSFGQSPAAGLASLAPITQDGTLDSYQPYHAAYADMLRRDGQHQHAKQAYQRAHDLSASSQEQRYLKNRMVKLSARARQY